MTSSLVGKTVEFNGMVYSYKRGIEWNYSGLLAIEEFDSNERGLWINAYILVPGHSGENHSTDKSDPINYCPECAGENEDNWVTIDAGLGYGEFVWESDKVWPNSDGFLRAMTDDFMEAQMSLADMLDRRFNVSF